MLFTGSRWLALRTSCSPPIPWHGHTCTSSIWTVTLLMNLPRMVLAEQGYVSTIQLLAWKTYPWSKGFNWPGLVSTCTVTLFPQLWQAFWPWDLGYQNCDFTWLVWQRKSKKTLTVAKLPQLTPMSGQLSVTRLLWTATRSTVISSLPPALVAFVPPSCQSLRRFQPPSRQPLRRTAQFALCVSISS